MNVTDRRGLAADAQLVHVKVLRADDPRRYLQYIIVNLAYPHEVMRHVILTNYGEGTEQLMSQLTGTIEVADVVTSDWEFEVDKMADPLLRGEGYRFWTEYKPVSDIGVPETLLAHMLVAATPPEDYSVDLDGATDVVAKLATRFGREMDAGHHLAAIHTRRELESMRTHLGYVTADLDGRLEAIDSLLLRGLSL